MLSQLTVLVRPSSTFMRTKLPVCHSFASTITKLCMFRKMSETTTTSNCRARAAKISKMTANTHPESESDAILRVCAYHRRDFALTLVRSRPHDMQKVQKSIRTAFESEQACAGLGALDNLPTEVLLMVLRNLDLLSYWRFRQVNRRARALATALREYKLVAEHGLEGLRGLLRANIAHKFTALDLYRSLRTLSCSCGEFGGFLFLPTATRCCFKCIRESPEFCVLSTHALSKLTKITGKRLGKLSDSIFPTVPGSYSMFPEAVKRPKRLIAKSQATAALQHSGVLDNATASALEVHKGQECHRLMASTAFPWYNSSKGLTESGVCCKGCQAAVEARTGSCKNRNRIYSAAGFLTHFTGCEEARNMWTQSCNGTIPIAEPEATRQGGFMSPFGPDGLPR